jgi:hypothetical protein
MKQAESSKTSMIEVISFMFFTLFAMILAFFTSAKAFATPGVELRGADVRVGHAVVCPQGDASPAPRALP